MMLSKKRIADNIRWLSGISEEIKQKSDLCFIVSDATRVKILFLLDRHRELCVTDLSNILNISMSAVSHQLSLLEKASIIKKTKMGKNVCYSMDKKGGFVLSLLGRGRLSYFKKLIT